MGRTISFVRGDGGEIRIEGQDLGAEVEAIMGAGIREYEWTWVIDADNVTAAVAALGGAAAADPLVLLKAWTKAHDDADPGVFLRDAGVEMRFWSRFGE